ncbi:MAG: lipid-A-disaccharide synthase N-terminal domain-containing protein [Parachlamydiaceae bacterium]|nr:lipid-A-disaccharide synthase N-terminal domain-containing protein [Parachlamydiaceae bacterium]
MDDWRVVLYPLGFLSAIAFGLRFIIQWLQSEKARKSIVTPLFWKISLIGNILLMIHSFIQIQFHISVIQALNAVVSWRNLNLMQTKSKPVTKNRVIAYFFAAICFTSLAFWLQEAFFSHDSNWYRTPLAPWQTTQGISPSFFWNFFGTVGYCLFSSRFWIQWWYAEKAQTSVLPLLFWWLSLSGALISIIYFIYIKDSVNIIGMAFGIVPYIRNIIILNKT